MKFISDDDIKRIADTYNLTIDFSFLQAVNEIYLLGVHEGREDGQRELNQMWVQAIENFSFPKRGIA